MPPISGSQASVLDSQSDIARCGATRAGTHSFKVFVKIAGVQRAYNRPTDASRVLVESLRITGRNGSLPNQAKCRAMGFTPSRLDEIIITLGSVNRHRREFAGVILNTRQRFVGDTDSPVLDLSCVDYGWQLNALVTGHFTGTYDEVAIELVQTYAPGFSTVKIQTGLGTVPGGISFTNVRLRDALDRLAARAGARWRPDYQKRILFGTSDYLFLTNPVTLTGSLSTFLFDPESFFVERDRSQQITRVHCEGGGAAALVEVAVGETTIPLTAAPAEWYGDDGGEVIIGLSQQIVRYAARHEGGAGGLVGPGAAPATAPVLAMANGAGVTSGLHEIAVVFKTGSGQSIAGPVASVTVGDVSAPATAPTPGSPTSGGSVDSGDHDYAMTLVTAVGETTPSPVSASVSIRPAPTVAPTFAIGAAYTDGSTGASHTSKVRYCYVYDDGTESSLSPESSEITPPANTGWDMTVPSTQPAGVASRRIYMSTNASGYVGFRNLAYGDPSTFSNTTGSPGQGFRDRIYGTNGSPTGVAKQTVPLTVPTSPLAIVTNRKLYRRFNATGTYKLVTTLNNADTSYNDTTANSGLGADAPSSNTATANQIALSAIAIGPAAVTDRELYMSAAGGGARKLALTIANNTATTGTITMSDATLAGQAAEPSSDTSGLAQESGQVLPGSTELEVAGAAALPSAGWAEIEGGQVIRYTGNDGVELSGIPATGPGAITAPVQYNSTVKSAPQLTGITVGSPSAGSITNTIPKGAPVNLWVTVNNLDAQAAVSALLDPDDDLGGLAGIIPDVISDERITRAEAIARATAHLDSQDDEHVTLGFSTLDLNAIEGRTQVASLVPPTNVSETLQIQDTDVFWTDADPPIPPVRTVTASTKRFTFEELLRRVRET